MAGRVDHDGGALRYYEIGQATSRHAIDLIDGRVIGDLVRLIKSAPGVHAALETDGADAKALEQLCGILRRVTMGANGHDFLSLREFGEMTLLFTHELFLGDIQCLEIRTPLDTPGLELVLVPEVEQEVHLLIIQPLFQLFRGNDSTLAHCTDLPRFILRKAQTAAALFRKKYRAIPTAAVSALKTCPMVKGPAIKPS